MNPVLEKQLEVILPELKSLLMKVAMGAQLLPCAKYVTGPDSETIPAGVKSFLIMNLGKDGAFEDITVSGIAGIDTIKAAVISMNFSAESDLSRFKDKIVVTPAADHIVLLQYIL